MWIDSQALQSIAAGRLWLLVGCFGVLGVVLGILGLAVVGALALLGYCP